MVWCLGLMLWFMVYSCFWFCFGLHGCVVDLFGSRYLGLVFCWFLCGFVLFACCGLWLIVDTCC